LDDAFGKAKELGNAPDAKVVKYGPPFSLSRFFRIFGQADSKIELTLPKQLVPQLESGRAYFLPSYYAPKRLVKTVRGRAAIIEIFCEIRRERTTPNAERSTS
jgi:hypothetical protein